MKDNNKFVYNSDFGEVFLQVVVIPSSKINKISYDLNGNLRIKLTSPAINGEANKQLLKQLSKYFKVKLSDLEIISGLKSRRKKISIKKII